MNAPIHLTETDMDDWRDAVVYGTGPLCAYAPDPDADLAVPPIPASAPAPAIDWSHRRPDRVVQGVRLVLLASAFVFAFGLVWGRLA